MPNEMVECVRCSIVRHCTASEYICGHEAFEGEPLCDECRETVEDRECYSCRNAERPARRRRTMGQARVDRRVF